MKRERDADEGGNGISPEQEAELKRVLESRRVNINSITLAHHIAVAAWALATTAVPCRSTIYRYMRRTKWKRYPKSAKKKLPDDERARRERMYRAEIGFLLSRLDGEEGNSRADGVHVLELEFLPNVDETAYRLVPEDVRIWALGKQPRVE